MRDAILNTDAGYYDFSLSSSGDIATLEFFDTSILYSLFGEKRASADEVVEPSRRRGWIGNFTFENGSKLWLMEQSRLTRDIMNRIEDESKKALQWLVDDGYAVSIDQVTTTLSGGRLLLNITIRRSRDKIIKKQYNLWENSGVT